MNQRYEASYFLDLSKNRDRALALRLRERAKNEPGENWINERLDGIPFQLDEKADDWVVPKSGILELEFRSRQPSQVDDVYLTHCWVRARF